LPERACVTSLTPARRSAAAGPLTQDPVDALTPVLFLIGLVLLVLGANALVRGAADLAAGLGTPPLIIGLTIVAFGTSAPEVLVSLQAAASGESGIALGNVIGSNIFNILFILGVSALIAPLRVSAQLVRLDVPVMIFVSVLALLLALDGRIARIEGAVLAGGIVAYTAFLARQAKRGRVEPPKDAVGLPALGTHWALNLLRIGVGLALLVLGARWLIGSATEIARLLGISELVVGLTIVAAGTSLPEVATSIAATVRGERDIAVGNVVGSNIFNLLLVLGGAAMIGPAGIPVPPAALTFDLPVMTAVAVACLPIFFTGYTIARWEGAVFLGYYVAYTAFIVLDATNHDVAPIFAGVMLMFVIPLTLLTSALIWLRKLRTDRPPQS
jgi:cation:H+ antiporter